MRRRAILRQKIFRQTLAGRDFSALLDDRLHDLPMPLLLRRHQALQQLVMLGVGVPLRQLLDPLLVGLNEPQVR